MFFLSFSIIAYFDAKTLDKTKMEEPIVELKENLSDLKKLEQTASENRNTWVKAWVTKRSENLKKDAETRASGLEAEVKRLREDLTSIRDLLGLNLDKRNSGKSWLRISNFFKHARYLMLSYAL